MMCLAIGRMAETELPKKPKDQLSNAESTIGNSKEEKGNSIYLKDSPVSKTDASLNVDLPRALSQSNEADPKDGHTNKESNPVDNAKSINVSGVISTVNKNRNSRKLEDDDVYYENEDPEYTPPIQEISRTEADEVPPEPEPEPEESKYDPSDFIEQEEEQLEESEEKEKYDISSRGRCILNELIDTMNHLIKQAERQDKYYIKLNSVTQDNAEFFINDMERIFDDYEEYREGSPDYYDEDRSDVYSERESGPTGEKVRMDDVYYEDSECHKNKSNRTFQKIVRADNEPGFSNSSEDINSPTEDAVQDEYCAYGDCGQYNEDAIDDSQIETDDERKVKRVAIRRRMTNAVSHRNGHFYRRVPLRQAARFSRRVPFPQSAVHRVHRVMPVRYRSRPFKMHHIVI